jgi:hypothetical protein
MSQQIDFAESSALLHSIGFICPMILKAAKHEC